MLTGGENLFLWHWRTSNFFFPIQSIKKKSEVERSATYNLELCNPFGEGSLLKSKEMYSGRQDELIEQFVLKDLLIIEMEWER